MMFVIQINIYTENHINQYLVFSFNFFETHFYHYRGCLGYRFEMKTIQKNLSLQKAIIIFFCLSWNNNNHR